MQQQALGNDGGVAEGQLKQGAANAAAAQMAGAAGARGGGANLAAAQNTAMNNGAGLAANANEQAAQMRNQNQQAAIGNSANLAQGLLGQQAGMAQANSQLQQGYEGQANQVGESQLQAQGNQQQLQSQNQLTQQQQAIQQGTSNAQANSGLVSSVIGGVTGAIGSMFSSDENAKTNIMGQAGGAGAAKPGGGDMFDPRAYSQSGGPASGEAALAARDAHTANFKQMGQGMGNWENISNAKPWSPESDAAQANMNHYMGGSSQQMSKQFGGQGQPNSPHMMLSDGEQKEAIAPESEHVTPEPADPGQDYIGAAPRYVPGEPLKSKAPPTELPYNVKQENAWDDYYTKNRSDEDPRNHGYKTMDEYLQGHANPAQTKADAIAGARRDADKAEGAKTDAMIGTSFNNVSKAFGGTPAAHTAPAGESHAPSHEHYGIDRHEYKPVEYHTNLTSDENAKQNMRSQHDRPQNEVQAFAKSIDPITYDYKDKSVNGGHRRMGFTAQALEKTPTGPDLVKNTPRGKVVNIEALASANTAVAGDHEARISEQGKKIDHLTAMLQHAGDEKSHDSGSLVSDEEQKERIKPMSKRDAELKRQADELEGKVDDGTWIQEKDKPKPRPKRQILMHPAMMAPPAQEAPQQAPAAQGGQQPQAPVQPAGAPNLSPTMAPPQEHGIYEATTGTRMGDTPPEMLSDTAAKKDMIRQEAFKAGQESVGGSPGQESLANPDYRTPVVQSPEQHEAIMNAIGFRESHPGIDAAELQRHIDGIMARKPPPPVTLAPSTVDPWKPSEGREMVEGVERDIPPPPAHENLGTWDTPGKSGLQSAYADQGEEAHEAPIKRKARTWAPRPKVEYAGPREQGSSLMGSRR